MDKDAKRLGRRMLALYQEQEPALKKFAADEGTTCRKGCSHCCNLVINISFPEAVAIAESILQLPPEALGKITRELYLQTEQLSFDQQAYFDKNIPCVFLDKEKGCSIYGVRPQPCRSYYVVSDPAKCSSEAGVQTVARLDTMAFDLPVTEEALRVSKQRGLPPLIAPIPVSVLWALRFLTEGEASFLAALRNAEPMGMADIRVWTQHMLDGLQQVDMVGE
jgi:Fe-S-cluster containining protein